MKQQIQFELGGTLTFRAVVDGHEVAVDASQPHTVTVKRADNETDLPVAVQDEEATIEGDGTLSYPITAAQATLDDPEANLMVAWTFSYNGVQYVRRDLFDVVRSVLYVVVTDQDIKDELGQGQAGLFYKDSETTYSALIQRAFEDLCLRIEAGGRRPALILESGQIKNAHLALVLSKIFFNESQTGDDGYWKKYKDKRDLYDLLMDQLPLRYDGNDDGKISQGEEIIRWGTANNVRA